MTTGSLYTNVVDRKLLAYPDLGVYMIDYLRELVRDTHSKVFERDGSYGTKLGLTGGGVDKFSITGTSKASDGLGHIIDTEQCLRLFVNFENAVGILYYVGMRYNLRPSGIVVNPRTGKPDYQYWREYCGEKAEPDAVVDNGDGTMTVTVNSVCEAGVSNAGRRCLIWRKVPADGALTEAIAVENKIIAWDGSNNKITTTAALGQSPISTTVSDYQVMLNGPTVCRNTDLSTVTGVFFIGTVLGVGAGSAPTVFNTANQTLYSSSLASISDISAYDINGHLKVDVKSFPGEVNQPQITVRNTLGAATFVVDELGNVNINGNLDVVGTTTEHNVETVYSDEMITGNLTAGDATTDVHTFKGTINAQVATVVKMNFDGVTGNVGIGGAAHATVPFKVTGTHMAYGHIEPDANLTRNIGEYNRRFRAYLALADIGNDPVTGGLALYTWGAHRSNYGSDTALCSNIMTLDTTDIGLNPVNAAHWSQVRSVYTGANPALKTAAYYAYTIIEGTATQKITNAINYYSFGWLNKDDGADIHCHHYLADLGGMAGRNVATGYAFYAENQTHYDTYWGLYFNGSPAHMMGMGKLWFQGGGGAADGYIQPSFSTPDFTWMFHGNSYDVFQVKASGGQGNLGVRNGAGEWYDVTGNQLHKIFKLGYQHGPQHNHIERGCILRYNSTTTVLVTKGSCVLNSYGISFDSDITSLSVSSSTYWLEGGPAEYDAGGLKDRWIFVYLRRYTGGNPVIRFSERPPDEYGRPGSSLPAGETGYTRDDYIFVGSVNWKSVDTAIQEFYREGDRVYIDRGSWTGLQTSSDLSSSNDTVDEDATADYHGVSYIPSSNLWPYYSVDAMIFSVRLTHTGGPSSGNSAAYVCHGINLSVSNKTWACWISTGDTGGDDRTEQDVYLNTYTSGHAKYRWGRTLVSGVTRDITLWPMGYIEPLRVGGRGGANMNNSI